MKKNRAFGSILAALGILVLVTPRYILPVCEFVSPGHELSSCSFMFKAELGLGFVAIAISLAMFLSRTDDALKWLSFSSIFTGAAVLAMPNVTGYCLSPRMPCHYGAVPALRIIGGLIVIVSITGFFAAKTRRQA